METQIDQIERPLDRKQLKSLPESITQFHALQYTLSRSPRLIAIIAALQDPFTGAGGSY